MSNIIRVKVIFVCLGNICRSPMAEGIFQNIVEKEGLSEYFLVNSAGTSRYHIGEVPDERALKTCSEKDIILNHLGQEFITKDLSEWDYILAMDQNNLHNIRMLENGAKKPLRSQVFLMRDFDLQHKGADVPDPYYGGMNGFYEVFDMLERSSYELLRYIRSMHSF